MRTCVCMLVCACFSCASVWLTYCRTPKCMLEVSRQAHYGEQTSLTSTCRVHIVALQSDVPCLAILPCLQCVACRACGCGVQGRLRSAQIGGRSQASSSLRPHGSGAWCNSLCLFLATRVTNPPATLLLFYFWANP